MSFYYPLGLLGLIGIPIILLIYIIKSKYTEQTIASTYLWELSEKFLKKRKPISRLTGIISLLLQLFAVLVVSVIIAHPVFTVRASANDIFIILDGSASMNMQQGKSTRFAIAKDHVNEIIDDARDGSTYTLILAGDTVHAVFEGITDKEQAKIYVDALSAGWTASDCASAMPTAQSYFDANRSAVLYLITDKAYEVNDTLRLIDVSGGENNIAFYSYAYAGTAQGVCGTGQVLSYAADTTVSVEMWIAAEKSAEPVRVAQTEVTAVKGEPTDFVLQSDYSAAFAQLQLRIVNNDALREDNRVILYDEAKGQARKVLLVSDWQSDKDDAVYLRAAIASAGSADVEVIDGETYAATLPKDYGMYVFNGYEPAELPRNAAIWLVDAVADGTDAGIGFRDYVTPRDAEGPNSYFVPEYTSESSPEWSALTEKLTRDIVGRKIAIRTYAQYNVPRNFTSVLSVGGDDVVFAGLNKNGDRQVVFAFRMQDSNLGMTDDFLILVRNLMAYSFPSVLDSAVYVCGDVMPVNVVPGCEGIVLTTPSGKSSTLDTLNTDVCEVSLTETGTYTLTVKVRGADETDVFAYACVPESESRSAPGGAMLLGGERTYEYSDGYYDKLLLFFIAIAVLLLADWGVYCYEQYQLR